MATDIEMTDDVHAFWEQVEAQMISLPINLHEEMMVMVLGNQTKRLAEFCANVILKVTEVQQYIQKLFIPGMASSSPELIASYSFFIQQLLAIYAAANVHLARLHAKNNQ